MTWLNAFELMCYLIVALMLADLIRKKNYDDLFTFGAAALVGYLMELAAVALTDIYYYNPGFFLNIGSAPAQFPLFGGLMWGALTVYGIRLGKKLNFGPGMTSLAAGMFIVTMDILLDVVAIRLDSGFWVWKDQAVTNTITQHAFLSVIWVNFLGYMIETPTVTLLTLRKRGFVPAGDMLSQSISMVLITLGSIIVTALGSLIALGLNSLTNDWFACIAFVLLWAVMIVKMVRQALRVKLRPAGLKKWDFPMLVFWLAMYIYCLAAVVHLGLTASLPWLLPLGVVFLLATAYTAISEPKA